MYRFERREHKHLAKKRKMPKHGKELGRIYSETAVRRGLKDAEAGRVSRVNLDEL